jgi:hypothetical protein
MKSKFFKHSQGKMLKAWIDKQTAAGLKTRVISHSWGADTALGIVAKGHKVDKLITVDPVGWFRPNLANVRKNAGVWLNYDADSPGRSFDGGNFWAWIGRSYNNAPEGYAHKHYDIPTLNHVQICQAFCRQE